MIAPKAYIHSNRLKKNILKIGKFVGNKNLMIVVKANGYGHDALKVASYLSNDSQIIFCVFTIKEALELRQGGIKNDILIFSRLQPEWLTIAAENNLWVNASHIEDLNILNKFFKKNNTCPKIHLKFDTGMTRLGFDIINSNKIFQYISSHSALPIEGVYSHFSTADEGDLSYAESQLSKFKKVIKKGEKYGINFKYIHCSNSGAILNLPDAMFNTVRVGILAYGVAPSSDVKMKIDVEPVMSFCGPIINVRKVSANTPVSYGGKYKTKECSNIGVIQAGFADGFPRPWYRDGYVSYKGSKYKIAGRVCMDQFMVDFKDVKPRIGDEVLIFGKKDLDYIPIEMIAKSIDSTAYVLLTAIHGRTEHIII